MDGKTAEFLLGHKIDRLDYNRFFMDPDAVAREYLKIIPYLNIITSDRPFHKIDESEVEVLRQQVRTLEEQLKEAQEAVKPENITQIIRDILTPEMVEKLLWESANTYANKTGGTVQLRRITENDDRVYIYFEGEKSLPEWFEKLKKSRKST